MENASEQKPSHSDKGDESTGKILEKLEKKRKRRENDTIAPDGKRLRDFYANVCRERVYFGKLDTSIHTDLIHVIKGYGKKRPRIRLSRERLNVISQALRAAPDCPYNDVEEVRKFILKSKEEKLRNFDAEKYYDQNKTVAYTANNQVAQKRLSSRCVDLQCFSSTADEPTGEMKALGLGLDIGCGSGLSTEFAHRNPKYSSYFTIGMDRSPDMLSQCNTNVMDCVLIDMGQSLPFRSNVFDSCVSVSAIHFLFGPKDEKKRGERLMSSLSRVLIPKMNSYLFSAQFFPETPGVPDLLVSSAQQNGFKFAKLLLDFTHHTTAFRWYLHCWPENENAGGKESPRRCLLNEQEKGVDTVLGKAEKKSIIQCCLCLNGYKTLFADKDHIRWEQNRHARKARQLIRQYNHDPSVIENVALRELAETLRNRFGAKVSQEEINNMYDNDLHDLIHPCIL